MFAPLFTGKSTLLVALIQLHNGVDILPNLLIRDIRHIFMHIGIYTNRSLNISVSEKCHQSRNVHATAHTVGGEGMAKLVTTKIRKKDGCILVCIGSLGNTVKSTVKGLL